MAALRLLHTNDLHGKLSDGKLPFLIAQRQEVDLFFDSGDAVSVGNLGAPLLRPDPIWPRLAAANCSAGVPGNRESHLETHLFARKREGCAHPLVCANLFDKAGGLVLPASVTLQTAGLRVGVVGTMVPMVTARMNARHISAFLWTEPVAAAEAEGRRLRDEVDVLIALTHIGLRRDKDLAATGVFDLILGGHSHDILAEPLQIGSTFIAQGGSHARFVGRYTWNGTLTEAALIPWEEA